MRIINGVLVDAGGRPTYYDLLPCNNLDNRMHTRYNYTAPINALLKNSNVR